MVIQSIWNILPSLQELGHHGTLTQDAYKKSHTNQGILAVHTYIYVVLSNIRILTFIKRPTITHIAWGPQGVLFLLLVGYTITSEWFVYYQSATTGHSNT